MKSVSLTICLLYFWLIICEISSNNLKASHSKLSDNTNPPNSHLKKVHEFNHTLPTNKVANTYYQKGNHFVVNTESLLDEEKLLLRE